MRPRRLSIRAIQLTGLVVILTAFLLGVLTGLLLRGAAAQGGGGPW